MSTKRRFFVSMWLVDFKTQTSGDWLAKEGDWYFRVGRRSRFPSKGTFRLGKNEAFDFEERNKPLLYSSMINSRSRPLKIPVRVKEQDFFWDDTFLSQTVEIPFETTDRVIELVSRDKRINLKVRLVVSERPNW